MKNTLPQGRLSRFRLEGLRDKAAQIQKGEHLVFWTWFQKASDATGSPDMQLGRNPVAGSGELVKVEGRVFFLGQSASFMTLSFFPQQQRRRVWEVVFDPACLARITFSLPVAIMYFLCKSNGGVQPE